MPPPSLDVVIVSYNTKTDTLACLRSLFAAPPSGLNRTWVVDNASGDGSVDAIRQAWPKVDVIALEKNAGFGAANNVALRRSDAALVLLLNSDTIVPAGQIDALVARLEATGAVAAGPRLVDGEGRPEISYGRMLSPLTELTQRFRVRVAARSSGWARRYATALVADERQVDWVSGACLLLRREAGAAAGFFDERYFLYEEDVDLCAALRARGGRVFFTSQAEVIHLRGRSQTSSGAAGPSHYDRSHVAFYQKHRPGWAPWLRGWLRIRGRSIR